MTPTSLKLSQSELERARAVARASGCTPHAVLCGAVRAGLAVLEAAAAGGRVALIETNGARYLALRDDAARALTEGTTP
jgi:hypothetical protein